MKLPSGTAQLLSESVLCVMSSLGSDGQPQSAIVGFSSDTEGNIVIGTSRRSRKCRNIERDPRVSVVIGRENGRTLQIEGRARIAIEDRAKYQALHIEKFPSSAHYRDDPDEVYIVVTPEWLRYTDTSMTPWRVEEVEV